MLQKISAKAISFLLPLLIMYYGWQREENKFKGTTPM